LLLVLVVLKAGNSLVCIALEGGDCLVSVIVDVGKSQVCVALES